MVSCKLAIGALGLQIREHHPFSMLLPLLNKIPEFHLDRVSYIRVY